MDICSCSACAYHIKSQRILGRLCYLDIMTNCFLVKSLPIGQALLTSRLNSVLWVPLRSGTRGLIPKKKSEKIECFIIPSDGSMSPGIVELKRVPRCAHLVVGRNIYGEFSLWDITKLNCVSSFSASKYPINEFFPISLSDLQTKGLALSYASIEEKSEKLLGATNFWLSEQRETGCVYLPTEDVAMWFLVSTPSDFDCCQNQVSTSSHHDVHTARSWRLALLVKNSIVFGSPLDPRTTTAGVSGGYGIISTSDGVVYMWELSRGSKLDTLHHFHDGTVTSVATDDLNLNSRSAVGVAGDAGQLLLYLHLHDPNSKE